MTYPIPADEDARIAALEAFQILDTPPDQRFDRITRLAAQQLGITTAVVSLVDRERQWFKSCFNLDATQTPRDVAFCAHAIMTPDMMVVEDACADPRFAQNPLVTGEPRLRFYAGMPLITSAGHALGTLCLIDYAPRRFSDQERALLEEFARIVLDALELHRANHLLREKADALTTANTHLQHFNHAIAHDLRGPLRTIASVSEILLEDAESSDGGKQAEMLTMVRSAGQRALRLTDDLMHLIAVGNRASKPLETVDLEQVLQDVLSDLTSSLADANATVDVARLPQVRGYASLLHQLFQNLIANSLAYRKPGQPARVQVRVEADTPADDDRPARATITVSDDGCGFEAELSDRLFEPFYRVHHGEGRTSAGLGLTICRRVTEVMDGRIWATSQLGQGATFHVELLRVP